MVAFTSIELKNKTNKRIKKVRKIITRTFAVLLVLIILMVIIFSIPSVQTKVAKRVTDSLNETYDVSIQIDRLGLNWKGEFDARGVYIEDHKQDTLIFAEELQTDVLNFRNLFKDNFSFGNIKMSNAFLNYKTYKGEERDNLYIFSQKFNTGTKNPDAKFYLSANNVTLVNSRVYIQDENRETPELLMLEGLNLDADDLRLEDIEVFGEINSMSVTAQRGFEIESLQGSFAYTVNEMRLENLDLKSNQSHIKGDLKFGYGDEGMSDFINGVDINADFDATKLSTNDLNSFYNEFGPNQILQLDGNFKGNLNDFTFNNAVVKTGTTVIRGDFDIRNLLNDFDYDIKAKRHQITTSYYDLRRFMPRVIGNQLPEQIKPLGTFTFNGNTTISTTKLSTNSTLFSNLGNVEAILEIDQIDNTNRTTYQGDIKLQDFNLGKLVSTPTLGAITANVTVDGRGFTQQTVNTQIKGTIASFVFQGYNYKNIVLSGNLKDPKFNGDLTINDENVKLDFKGLVDVSKKFNQYDFEANVEFAELNKLNLIKRDSVSVFAGRIIMDMDGTNINDAAGTIQFKETFYQNERDDFYFDDFQIVSSFEGPVRTIEVNSPDIIDGEISGEFVVEDIPALFQNGIASIYTNYIPAAVTTNQYIDYDFTVYNRIVELFVPILELGENTRLKGSVSSDESKFKLDFKSPEILIAKNYLNKVNIQVDNNNPLYNTYISIDSVYTGVYNLTEVDIINKTLNDTLYLQSEFKGGKDKADNFDLSMYHTINPDGKSVVGFSKSKVFYNNNDWFINEKNDRLNKVVFDDNFSTLKVDSLLISHNEELIQLAGVLRDSTYKDFKLKFTNVDIGKLVPSIDSLRMEGNVNGRLDFLQKKGAFYPNSTVTIDNVVINETAFGDLNLDIKGNQDLTKYDINSTLINNNVKSINAVGNIDVTGSPTIDLNVSLNDFNLKALSPFGGDVISNIRGLVSGNTTVRGNYKSPNINGRLNLEGSGLKIPYLNTDFDIADNSILTLTKNKFEITPTQIVDVKYRTEGILSGNATHTNFQDWELNLLIDAPDRLIVLDTPPVEDALYYGTAFISGNASISGPVQELVIDVNATTEEGTTFKIPISETQTIGDDSFVRFLSPDEKQARISGESIVTEDVKGLSLNFELDINEKAEVEVVVDQTSGSTLKGRGAGILLIEISTLGKFNMWGDFLVIDGTFDFKYGGFVNKKIDVQPGGSINWDGKPERARLNLSALYKTAANPSPLLDTPTGNRKIPVEVIVDLTGELIQPDLNFRINFPRASSIVRSELEYKLQNKEQRETQALFLVASNQFIGDDFSGAGSVGGNLGAEFVSSLVGDILSDKDGKFRVALNYQPGQRTPSAQNADRFGVTLTTQISDRLLINGNVGVPVGGVNDTGVAGDVEVQWLVNEDGSLRMNFFNRQADIQFIGEDQIFEQGLGMSYSVDFDTFSELVFKLFNKKLSLEKAKEEELPVVPDDSGLPKGFGESKGILPDEE